ncbi:MAG: hypothetical protein ACHQU0_03765 [Candidatus Paceibacteria bacterium]
MTKYTQMNDRDIDTLDSVAGTIHDVLMHGLALKRGRLDLEGFLEIALEQLEDLVMEMRMQNAHELESLLEKEYGVAQW